MPRWSGCRPRREPLDPAPDPLWISPKEPFKGANKKNLGFQVIIRVAPEAVAEKK